MAKVLVEDCLCLDVVVLTRPGPLEPGFGGTYYFYKDDKEIESIPWEFLDDCVRFHCWRAGRDGKPVSYSYWVLVTYTPAEFKGKRAWFQCPGCDKRVRKLFRPPGNMAFKCRDCHDLTYASKQRQSDRWIKAVDRELALREWERMRGLDVTQALEEEADRLEAYLEAGRSLAPVFRYIQGRGELPAEPPGGVAQGETPL
jgi:hypothetical protein